MTRNLDARTANAVTDRSTLEPEWQRAFDWIERQLGIRIHSFDRQARWRPAFFCQAEKDGKALPLYLRGERGALDHGVYPFELEAKVFQVLEAEGLPAPHIYGVCPDPKVIVMDQMPGRPDLSTAADEAERVAVLNHFMDLLADLHRIDPRRFEEIGYNRPKTPQALGLSDLDRWEASYRKGKKRPEPLIEFVNDWLRRNVPADRDEVACLQGDTGQFLFENGRVTTFIDMELAHLGDPAADLAVLRGRDMAEPMGDLKPAYERYFKRTGKRIPNSVIDYHTVRFNLATPFTCAPLVAEPPDTVDFIQYLGWYWVWSRACIEVMADSMGIPLPTPTIPEPARSIHAPAHDLLVRKLGQLRSAEEGFKRYELDTTWRNASYLARVESMAPAMDAEEAAEIDKLLGRKTTPIHREAELERFVLEQGAKNEVELMQLFQKRCLRQEALYAPVARELRGVKTQLLGK
ncbi:phosphotransferase family protein [Myxococcota bacterium]|nr:phosphotransferase family protein [Myxococcota bacterium]